MTPKNTVEDNGDKEANSVELAANDPVQLLNINTSG